VQGSREPDTFHEQTHTGMGIALDLRESFRAVDPLGVSRGIVFSLVDTSMMWKGEVVLPFSPRGRW
jgi:hypothetical protein